MRICEQVHPGGLRHIRSDRRINEWRAPGRKTITRAATNERQVVIAMSGGELIYFELAGAGTLMETEKKEVGGDIASLAVGPVPTGRQRSRFLAVGGFDSTVSPGHDGLLGTASFISGLATECPRVRVACRCGC